MEEAEHMSQRILDALDDQDLIQDTQENKSLKTNGGKRALTSAIPKTSSSSSGNNPAQPSGQEEAAAAAAAAAAQQQELFQQQQQQMQNLMELFRMQCSSISSMVQVTANASRAATEAATACQTVLAQRVREPAAEPPATAPQPPNQDDKKLKKFPQELNNDLDKVTKAFHKDVWKHVRNKRYVAKAKEDIKACDLEPTFERYPAGVRRHQSI